MITDPLDRRLFPIIQIIVNEETSRDTQEFLSKRLFAIKNQRSAGDTEELALVIGWCSSLDQRRTWTNTHSCLKDGKSLGFALEKETSQVFLELALMCKVS